MPRDEHAELPPTSERASRAFRRTKWLVLILVTLGVTGLDQWSKHWAQTELRPLPYRRITLVEGYASFSYVQNPGAAWGFLSRSPESFRKPFFLGVSVLAMLFILTMLWRLEPGQRLLLAALSLVMGGALGNFIDRLRQSYVVDFIDLHFKDRYRWPTFNVADIAITCGVILLLGEMFFGPLIGRRRAGRAALAAAQTAPPLEQAAADQDQAEG